MIKFRWGISVSVAMLVFVATVHAAKIDIAVYTETVQWIGQPQAQGEADIFMAEVKGKPGIGEVVNLGQKDIGAWAQKHTVKGGHHLIVLYGDFPPTLYPDKNAKPDGSIGELFLEAGNSYANSNDYFFWGLAGRNEEGGIKNMMDIPGIVQWDDNTAMSRTAEAVKIAPSIPANFTTDRPFHVDQLDAHWELEIAFGSNTGDQKGTRCDPCIIRNKDYDGRLIQVFQTNGLEQKEGKVLAEIVLNYYLDKVGALPVEPQDKASVLWGDLKARR